MYGNFLLIYLNWREICPLRMPKDLLCFLPNRGFVLKDTVCWPLPQDSKSRYLDDKWYIVDLCYWPAIWLLSVCCVYSNGIRHRRPQKKFKRTKKIVQNPKFQDFINVPNQGIFFWNFGFWTLGWPSNFFWPFLIFWGLWCLRSPVVCKKSYIWVVFHLK